MLIKNSLSLLFTISILPTIIQSQAKQDRNSINYRYKQNYSFVTMPDTVYTFESEFILPEGYRHADSSELTPFQNYVANFPLWHQFLPVGNWKQAIEFENSEVSRPVHLPHYGLVFTDRAIPIRILAEYLHDNNRKMELEIVPGAGDTLKYKLWLYNEVVYGPRKTVKYRERAPRVSTLEEYYTFMKTCMNNTTYKSLTYNCDSVKVSEVMPGDIFAAHNENGRKGVTFIIMHLLIDDQNRKLFAVATGCEKPCDFHIPLFNNDRNNPWLTVEQIKELGQDFPYSGFFRLKIK